MWCSHLPALPPACPHASQYSSQASCASSLLWLGGRLRNEAQTSQTIKAQVNIPGFGFPCWGGFIERALSHMALTASMTWLALLGIPRSFISKDDISSRFKARANRSHSVRKLFRAERTSRLRGQRLAFLTSLLTLLESARSTVAWRAPPPIFFASEEKPSSLGII